MTAPLRVDVVRLQPGDDLRAALQARGDAAACIVSGVGSFTQAVLRFAEHPGGTPIPGPLELLTLSGTLGRGGVHLHASVSDAQGRVFGGHLMPGCIVRTTAEIVVGVLDGWVFDREADAQTGFQELVARRTAGN